MKINSINNTTSFKRVIKIDSVTNPKYPQTRRKIDNSTFAVCKALNSEKTSTYSRKEAEDLRNFFTDILGDYNGENGIIMRRIDDGDVVLLSGEDAQRIKTLEEKKSNERAAILSNRKLSNNKKQKYIQKNQQHIDNMIRKYLEDGTQGKPEAHLAFESSQLKKQDILPEQALGYEPIKAKIDYISYSYLTRSYNSATDGYVDKSIPAIKIPTCKARFVNANYEEKTLTL